MQRFQHYIDGVFEDGTTSFESLDPATGTAWALMPDASAADVGRAVDAAYAAFSGKAWAGLTASARGKLLYRLADLVQAAAPRLAALETRDTGKIIRETTAQIAYVAEYYRYYAGLADKIEGAHLPIDKPDMEVWLRREPIGVVAAIVYGIWRESRTVEPPNGKSPRRTSATPKVALSPATRMSCAWRISVPPATA